MRLHLILFLLGLSCLPATSQAAWDIFQSYVIIDSGSGDQYLAGGINADGASAFAGTNLGDFTATDALTLNGGELKTYKNDGSNVCGGKLNYRVYTSGDTPGAFTALALPFSADLDGGDQKWAATESGIDLLGTLPAGDYVLELYWEATGDDFGGCSDTKFDSDFANNFTATFSVIVPGCTDPAYDEYDSAANTDDGSCQNLLGCTDSDAASMDGYNYNLTTIGDQCWFAENLRTRVYADGSAIPEVTDDGVWSGLNTGARCDYANDANNVDTYGRLYNWHAATDAAQLCPSGWHVPTDGEWTNLGNYISSQDFSGTEGTALKSTSGWGDGGNGTDDFGFAALPGGGRWEDHDGSFISAGLSGYWWSSSSDWVAGDLTLSNIDGDAWGRSISYLSSLNRGVGSLQNGFSVRCLRDADFTEVQGCTDPSYLEFDPSANVDDGSCATHADHCADALVLGSIQVDLSTTTLTSEDGSAALTVTTGTPTSLTLNNTNGAPNYTFSQPGAIDGIAAGYYEVSAIDALGCNSNTLVLVMPYSLCCDCGISDEDVDGLCDNEDHCTNRRAINYADTNNGECIIPGCMNPAYTEYYSEATIDDGSCATLAVGGCINPAYDEYDSAANTDDGSCQSLLGCTDSDVSSMDGYSYSLTTIGDQCWFAENLRTTVYADGSDIPEVTDNGAWAGLNSGARCDYENDASKVATYGRMYNWYAVDDARGLCPSGWHVPTDGEWIVLEMELGMSESDANSTGWRGTDQGTQLKSTSGWSNNGNGTDNFGFSALPGGLRNDANGNFYVAGYNGYWWSSSPDGGGAWHRNLFNSRPAIYRSNNSPRLGFSVRCLRDDDHTESQGCTDPSYLEFDASANVDDGSCTTLVVEGCTDSDAASMDGYSYSLTTIGDQCWFAENLRTTVYADGSDIPEVTGNGEWVGLSTGARCDYDNDASNVATYGRLYNWYAVDDSRGLCPSGWHVPTDGEWTELEDYLGANGHSGAEGTALKSTSDWNHGGSGTDDFGFSALPGGYRDHFNGYFLYAGNSGFWWSSSPSGGNAWNRNLNYYLTDINRYDDVQRVGFSVRCLRDAE